MFITLFGGMLFTAVLYGLGRLARLSNFWAAVIAAAIPSVAYMIYAIQQVQSLDVITIHMVAYPTVALLFGLLYGRKANHDANMHLVPKLLIGFFLALTVVMGVFVYIAHHGLPPVVSAMLLPDTRGKVIHTGFAGVVEHNQEAANSIAQHLDMQNKLQKLGWQLDVSGLNEIQAGIPSPVSVIVNDREMRPVENISVSLKLHHPGQAQEIVQPLAGGLGGYHASVPSLDTGHWVAHIILTQMDGDSIDLEHDIEVR
jgi:hypothetical protein